ncbi:MAG: AraC family transcriptional regulator [Bacteroidaceae bacterium]|nr:AraC family transcriptional regulator [Bacteroidaceae bacterium]
MNTPSVPQQRQPKQAPKLMTFSRIRSLLEHHIRQLREHIFFNSELAVLHGDPFIFRVILQQKPPFSIDDHRLGIITRGEIRGSINLVEKHLSAGSLIFIGPGSIISPISFSPDLEIHGIGLSANFPMPFAADQLPTAFNGQVRDFQLPASEADITTALSIIDTIWHIVHQPDYNRQTLSALVAAQMHHYNGLYLQHTSRLQSTLSHEQTLFDRFIYLVNQSATEHHQLSYYAQRMCLTERYLGTVVRQVSGTTAKSWIDRAIIARAKIELRHTDKSAAQLSEEMNFPNPSFFSKYFRRLTGQTPLEYRSAG